MKPEIKDLPEENALLKSIIQHSNSDKADPFLELWDTPMGDEDDKTFGDLMTNALDYSLDVKFEKKFVINKRKYPLVVNGAFNIKVLKRLFGKIVCMKCKPKYVSKIAYLTSPDVLCKFVEDRCDESTLVFIPTFVDEKYGSVNEEVSKVIEDSEEIVMTLADVDDNDIILFIHDKNLYKEEKNNA
jgi:hypothetical protein